MCMYIYFVNPSECDMWRGALVRGCSGFGWAPLPGADITLLTLRRAATFTATNASCFFDVSAQASPLLCSQAWARAGASCLQTSLGSCRSAVYTTNISKIIAGHQKCVTEIKSNLLLHYLVWVLHLDHACLVLLAHTVHSIGHEHCAKHTVTVAISCCLVHVSDLFIDIRVGISIVGRFVDMLRAEVAANFLLSCVVFLCFRDLVDYWLLYIH